MKAACLQNVRQLTIIDIPEPTIRTADDVLIKVQQVGICGSELHAFNGTHPYRKPPSILGHEMLGTVVAVGSNVSNFASGDRITVDPQWTCGACEWCLSGDYNLCPNKRVMGTPNWQGAFGEYVISPAKSVFHVPAAMSDDQATMIEPLAVAVHTLNRAQLREGQTALILGGGPIGLVTAAMSRVRGAADITVADVQPHCLEAARALGAADTLLVATNSVDQLAQQIMEKTAGRGFDMVFLTVGVDYLIDVALQVVRPQGSIVLVALFKHAVAINPFDVIKKDLNIVGTTMSTDEDVLEAIRLIESGQIDPTCIVSHHLPIDAAQYGFELAETKTDRAIKVVLTF